MRWLTLGVRAAVLVNPAWTAPVPLSAALNARSYGLAPGALAAKLVADLARSGVVAVHGEVVRSVA